ncbi:hypothetical protein, partial [Thiolapillus sp.]|uniref:hypothetical protein n=1 Tax=Thiolapillus sp. TaxID=2017437 RepID=UPI003AF6F74B
MTGRRVRRPTLFSLWRKARRENSAASRLLGSTSLRFALHGWQRLLVEGDQCLCIHRPGIQAGPPAFHGQFREQQGLALAIFGA